MDLSKMNYEDILNEDFHTNYLLLHKKFYHEMVEINVNLVMYEKLVEYYPKMLEENQYSEVQIIRTIHRMILLHLPLRVYRIIEKAPDVYSIRKFKNDVVRNINDDSIRSDIKEKTKSLISESSDFAAQLKEARKDFLAHKLMPYSNSNNEDKIFFEFSELKLFILELNEYFRLLTFNVEMNFNRLDDYEVDIRKQAIDRIGGDMDKIFSKLLNYGSSQI